MRPPDSHGWWCVRNRAHAGLLYKSAADRRHEFRDAKCARLTLMDGGASATGRMQVYFISPPLIGGMSSGMPNAPA